MLFSNKKSKDDKSEFTIIDNPVNWPSGSQAKQIESYEPMVKGTIITPGKVE